MTLAKILFFGGLLLAATGLLSPGLALAAGLAFGLTQNHPFESASQRASRFLLQASVVLLGFGMNLAEVWRAGSHGFAYTALTIVLAMGLGVIAGKWLRVGKTSALLITAGTAICGGSAIAAVAPIVGADEHDVGVSLGTVFVLNAVALFIFPPMGWMLHLSQPQFGLWAALAIHDTSSVVGAAARYGTIALGIATAVKLARALWIVPLSLVLASLRKNGGKVRYPWFIGLFCLAAVANSFVPGVSASSAWMTHAGKLGLAATLFLIGSNISRKSVAQVGVRPFILGIGLWVTIGTASLWLVTSGLLQI